MKSISYGKHSLDQKDINSVIKVLKSDFLTQGPLVDIFERKLSKFCKSKYAVSANSATSALHLTCMAINLKKNDIVWTVPNTFVATANCSLYLGCKIDLVDIDFLTLNISIDQLEKKLIKAAKIKKLPKAIFVVHFGGNVTDQKKVHNLSKRFNFKIIEDASHSLGAKNDGEMVGSCKWSDVTVFSFHPVKTITTIEGGAAMTNSKKIYEKMKILRSHGIVKDKTKFYNKKQPKFYYEQQFLGYNYRFSDVSAALGLSQLKKINKFLKKRNLIAKKYIKELKNFPVEFQKIDKKSYSSYHLFILKLKDKRTRDGLFRYLSKNRIILNFHYIPIFLHPFHSKNKINNKKYQNSIKHYQRSLSLPIYYNLKNKEQNFVIKKIKDYFNDKK
jgi:UDP-4-amino-4,6-dideoxy-N-acetyl-beta-L-altrosamine transaminase